MIKPEKKECSDENPYNCLECGDEGWVYGYNQACSDWEKYCNEVVVKTIEEYAHDVIPKLNDKWRKRLEKTLPTVEEIEEIVINKMNEPLSDMHKHIAKAIHKRLKGEK